MEMLELLAASGGPAGLIAGVLLIFLKKDKKASDCKHDALAKNVKVLTKKADTVQNDLSDIKIQIAKISTAVDLMVLGKTEKSNWRARGF